MKRLSLNNLSNCYILSKEEKRKALGGYYPDCGTDSSGFRWLKCPDGICVRDLSECSGNGSTPCASGEAPNENGNCDEPY